MDTSCIDDHLPEYVDLIHSLASEIEAGRITSWKPFNRRVLRFFTPAVMAHFETKLPGWQQMASYGDGVTLIHETAALVSLMLRDEYRKADPMTRILSEWIVLFHDLSKIARRGWRDHTHALRSATLAGLQLPHLGFPRVDASEETLAHWVEVTNRAILSDHQTGEPFPNKQEYPSILAGIARIFGTDTPAALIVKGVLLHMAINTLAEYPQANPLNDQEVRHLVSRPLFPLVRLMMLVDNDAWALFDPETREFHNRETVMVFNRLQRLVYR